MIVAFLLAAQAMQPQGFTTEEERALAAAAQCQKRYFDSVPPDDRRRRGEALIDESYNICASEEAAFRTALASRFNAQATERVMQLVRSTSRDRMLRYINR